MNELKNIPENQPVITGMGAVTPFGNGVDIFWDSIKKGHHAFSPITLFSSEEHRTVVAAEVPELPEVELLRVKKNTISRADHLALGAAYEALEKARLLDTTEKVVVFPERTALVVGTAAGGILGLEAFFRKRFNGRPVESPEDLLSSFCLSAIATNIAQEFIIKGPRLTLATVCSSSGLALAAAMELLESEKLDRVLVVGAETLCEVTHAGFNSLRSVAPERCQPFDLNRRGLILGEGAGAVVLERLSSATARGVSALAFLRGYGMRTDLHHFTAPQPEGNAVAETVRLALTDSHVGPEDIEHVAVHGTGTPLNDVAETRGLKKVFGRRAFELSISSIKSMIGHQLGAASIMQTIAAVLAIKQGCVPPTANLETPDPECDLDYVSHGAKKIKVKSVLSNAFAFGGSNISLVFSKTRGIKSPEDGEGAVSGSCIVITGIGLTTPLGIGSGPFVRSLTAGETGIKGLFSLGKEWEKATGGLVDVSSVREQIPSALRRRLNRQASFLFLSLKEAGKDSAVALDDGQFDAMTYGSAFGCSGNVHRFYSQILMEGPKYCSPQEFNMSVTNAPPSLVAKEFGMDGPIWVFSGDEASWEVSFHWAARLIQKGKAARVVVSAAEELSDSILAIHDTLGWKGPGTHGGHRLGEGSVSMVLESAEKAQERGARIYGSIKGLGTSQDTTCGPLDYSNVESTAIHAVSQSLEDIQDRTSPLRYIGNRHANDKHDEELSWLKGLWQGKCRMVNYSSQTGQSGFVGGLGMAAALLIKDEETDRYILVNTSSRGGIEAATLIERFEHA